MCTTPSYYAFSQAHILVCFAYAQWLQTYRSYIVSEYIGGKHVTFAPHMIP